MSVDTSSVSRAFAPHIMQRAIQAFDNATMVIVGSCWGGAIVIMLFALYTLNMSVSAKRQVIEAAATEPALPRIVTRPPELSELKPIAERLQKRFPDIGFSLNNDKSLTVTAQQGPKFRTWLTVLSYIDTISPQYRWQIKEFCVGAQCSSSIPMKAVLLAQKISFAATPVKQE
jgi:hypothetical protein